MAYGSVLTDTVQSSTAATAPVFKDGNGTQIGTLCRAWVNFNGTGTVAIRASFNVSSITDRGTGSYTINLITALPDTSAAVSGMTANTTSGKAVVTALSFPSTSSIDFSTSATLGGGAVEDSSIVTIAVFR